MNEQKDSQEVMDAPFLYRIHFKDATQMIAKEGCSKHLAEDSPLVDLLTRIRNAIKEKYPTVDESRPWHIELVHFDSAKATGVDPKAMTLERAKMVEGRIVDIRANGFGFISPRAFVLYVGNVPGYGMAHITTAYITDAPVKGTHFQTVMDIAQSVIDKLI